MRPHQEGGDKQYMGEEPLLQAHAYKPGRPHSRGTEEGSQEEKPWLDQFSSFLLTAVLGTGFHFLGAYI